MEDGQKMRAHGFERPFHPLQVLSWVVFGSDVLVYIIFCLPLIETIGFKVGVALFYAASVIVLVVATYKATSCNPVDPHVIQEDPDFKADDFDSMPYCTMCNVPVFNRSKHCRACNKCVTVFDHHCMWLNNCVGGENYRAFFVTISSVAVMIGIVLGTCLYLLLDYFLRQDEFQDRAQDIFKGFPKEFFLGLVITMTAINSPLFLLDMQLVLLHAFLKSQNLTTYEYIMAKRAKMESQEENGDDPERPPSAKAKPRILKTIRTLPRCMDWIVFCRCGQRRRRKQQETSIERIQNVDARPESADVAVAAGTPARGTSRPVDASQGPSPPGSTTDGMAGGTPAASPVPSRSNEAPQEPARPMAEEGDAVPAAPPASEGLQGSAQRSREANPSSRDQSRDVPEEASREGETQGVLVTTRSGCGCDASGGRQLERPSQPSKV